MWKFLTKNRFNYIDIVIIQFIVVLIDFVLNHLTWR